MCLTVFFYSSFELIRIYIGIRERLPFHCVNNHADLCKVGVKRFVRRYLLNMSKVCCYPLYLFVCDTHGFRPVQGGLDRWKSQTSMWSLTEGTPVQSTQHPPSNSLAPLLCYSCQGTLTSRSSKSVSMAESGGVVSLPVWTQAKLVDRERMKGEIQEFIIYCGDDE